MCPNRVQNEKQLNKNASEGQNSAHENTWHWFCVKDLLWNLSWDRVGSDWVFDWVLFVAHVCTNEDQWCTDTKPQTDNGDKSSEWDGGGGASVPEDHVHEEEDAKDESGNHESGEEDLGLPFFTTECFVESGGDIEKCKKMSKSQFFQKKWFLISKTPKNP